jgi:hypothetical protein
MKPERAWFFGRRREERPWRGNRFAFPLPTLPLPPLLGRFKASCDQRGIPPWNPRCFADEQSSEAEWELIFLAGENQRAPNLQHATHWPELLFPFELPFSLLQESCNSFFLVFGRAGKGMKERFKGKARAGRPFLTPVHRFLGVPHSQWRT